MTDQPETMDTWAILELMGHRRLAGRVTEETRFGVAMCRIDVPAVDDLAGFTQCYGGQAIYGLTPVSEQIARAMAAKLRARPVDVYDLGSLMRDKEAGQKRLAYDADDDGIPF